jgi:hypothetical protein
MTQRSVGHHILGYFQTSDSEELRTFMGLSILERCELNADLCTNKASIILLSTEWKRLMPYTTLLQSSKVKYLTHKSALQYTLKLERTCSLKSR